MWLNETLRLAQAEVTGMEKCNVIAQKVKQFFTPSPFTSSRTVRDVLVVQSGNPRVLIGAITSGVCRHMAILFKYTVDTMNSHKLRANLERARIEHGARHAWNTVRVFDEHQQKFVEERIDISLDTSAVAPMASPAAPSVVVQATPIKADIPASKVVTLLKYTSKLNVAGSVQSGGEALIYNLDDKLVLKHYKHLDYQGRRNASNEANALHLLEGCPVVVKLHECVVDSCSNVVGVVLERALTDLCTYLPSRQPFTTCLSWAIDIARGVEAVHEKGLVHRDLKPSNILLFPSSPHRRAKLADFGLARPVDSEGHAMTVNHCAGTTGFMSEELADSPATVASDIYALGKLLFTIFVPRLSLNPDYPQDVNKVVCTDLEHAPHSIRDSLYFLLVSCLKLPEFRPSARKVRKELEVFRDNS
eukprot:TRINITY_DN10721_c0_g1_i2.p1 TRINITY_DN10721_c0_g1~~TRINITY_DN10721_c0_g1_i2.p1  ORF type:complete len:418 (-),score=66.25 TRINITY_DN10721_c0_g1_i2:91-1344(-)